MTHPDYRDQGLNKYRINKILKGYEYSLRIKKDVSCTISCVTEVNLFVTLIFIKPSEIFILIIYSS